MIDCMFYNVHSDISTKPELSHWDVCVCCISWQLKKFAILKQEKVEEAKLLSLSVGSVSDSSSCLFICTMRIVNT